MAAVSITGSTFTGNTAVLNGGAIFLQRLRHGAGGGQR